MPRRQPPRQHWEDEGDAHTPATPRRERQPPRVLLTEEERKNRFLRPTSMIWFPHLQQEAGQ